MKDQQNKTRLKWVALVALCSGNLFGTCEMIWRDSIVNAGRSTILSIFDPSAVVNDLIGDGQP